MEQKVVKGLEGVLADESKVSQVDPEQCSLHYRGYNIRELAEQATFLEVAYLLLYGELPRKTELDKFTLEIREQAALPPELLEVYRKLPRRAHPMDYLRLGVTVLGYYDQDPWDYHSDALRRKAIRLMAAMPLMIGASYRIAHDQAVISSRIDLDFSANFIYGITGKVPDPLAARVFDLSLVLYAEHGFNASTFAARVVSSTLTDYYSAVSAAVGTLKGPLHGGANEKVMEMLLKLKGPKEAENYIRSALGRKEKVMGFGHRIYRKGDSRTPIMKEWGWKLARHLGQTKWHEMCDAIEEVVRDEKGLCANVDFPAAPAYYLMGLPMDTYTPIFAASRITGWTAHLIEQYENNRIIRPNCLYAGPSPRSLLPIDKR